MLCREVVAVHTYDRDELRGKNVELFGNLVARNHWACVSGAENRRTQAKHGSDMKVSFSTTCLNRMSLR